jgi:hypothetical protein
MSKTTPGLTELLPLFCALLLYNMHVLRTGRQQLCTDSRPGQSMHRARMKLVLTDQLQGDPSNGSEIQWGASHFCACAHTMQHACQVRCDARMLAWLHHTLGEDGTWSHRLIALPKRDPSNDSEKHRGAPSFCARASYAPCMRQK